MGMARSLEHQHKPNILEGVWIYNQLAWRIWFNNVESNVFASSVDAERLAIVARQLAQLHVCSGENFDCRNVIFGRRILSTLILFAVLFLTRHMLVSVPAIAYSADTVVEPSEACYF